jgi:hypothetical protein
MEALFVGLFVLMVAAAAWAAGRDWERDHPRRPNVSPYGDPDY